MMNEIIFFSISVIISSMTLKKAIRSSQNIISQVAENQRTKEIKAEDEGERERNYIQLGVESRLELLVTFSFSHYISLCRRSQK